VLKNVEKEEKVKSLLRKEFNFIKEYENERLQISKNTINTKPIYRQLQFEEEAVQPANSQPLNYNVNTSLPTSRIKTSNSSRYPFLEKNQTCAPTAQPTNNFKKENRSLLIELTNSISHNFKTEQTEEAEPRKNDMNKFKKIK
jgi:hypothetical protein